MKNDPPSTGELDTGASFRRLQPGRALATRAFVTRYPKAREPWARKFVMAERRGVRRVAPLFECGAGRSQLLPTAPGAVNQDDVFGFGHETKDDSQCARQCPVGVKLFCRREAGGGCARPWLYCFEPPIRVGPPISPPRVDMGRDGSLCDSGARRLERKVLVRRTDPDRPDDGGEREGCYQHREVSPMHERLVEHLGGVFEPGDIVGRQFSIADLGNLGGDPVLYVGMVPQFPQGEVTNTRAGATNFGSGTKRVIGPPASLSSASRVCKTRAAENTCRMGSGFFGTSGSAPTSSPSIVAVMAPR